MTLSVFMVKISTGFDGRTCRSMRSSMPRSPTMEIATFKRYLACFNFLSPRIPPAQIYSGRLLQTPDIPQRRCAEQAGIFTAELRRAFVAHTHCGGAGIDVFVQHQLTRILQAEPLQILQRAHARYRAEVLPESRWTHMCLGSQVIDRKIHSEVLLQPRNYLGNLLAWRADRDQMAQHRAMLSTEQSNNNFLLNQRPDEGYQLWFVQKPDQAYQCIQQSIIQRHDGYCARSRRLELRRKIHLGSDLGNNAPIQFQTNAKIGLGMTRPRNIRRHRQVNRGNQRLSRPIVKNLIAKRDTLAALHRYSQAQAVDARHRISDRATPINHERRNARRVIPIALGNLPDRLGKMGFNRRHPRLQLHTAPRNIAIPGAA
uniref:Uncharacterized protein n=1 Tax=uncultured bacterium BLR10 TaxID=506513 RepID=C0INS1_9BACT|nr:hypothetical protein AKSOIL_0178 [uncultured bacterium BLR10]